MSDSSTLAPLPARAPLLAPPGGVLLWVIVATELFAFGVFFAFVALLRRSDPAGFEAGRATLDPSDGLWLTACLLASGWMVAEAVHACRADRIDRARRWYAGAIAMGLLFVVLKAVGYAALFGRGVQLGTSAFFDAYLLGTGFHFIHVVIGLGMLLSTALGLGRARFEDPETSIAGTALFWHMCDVAWFFLFPLFYVA